MCRHWCSRDRLRVIVCRVLCSLAPLLWSQGRLCKFATTTYAFSFVKLYSYMSMCVRQSLGRSIPVIRVSCVREPSEQQWRSDRILMGDGGGGRVWISMCSDSREDGCNLRAAITAETYRDDRANPAPPHPIPLLPHLIPLFYSSALSVRSLPSLAASHPVPLPPRAFLPLGQSRPGRLAGAIESALPGGFKPSLSVSRPSCWQGIWSVDAGLMYGHIGFILNEM
jgi:hypothetical protein